MRGRRAADTVAVLGAGGIMGLPIATNLARAGFRVRAWNRSLSKAEPLTQAGVTIAANPAQAAGGAQVVLTMLADIDAVIAAMDGPTGALAELPPGSTWVQMSTIGETGTAECADIARRHRVSFADAPVLGSQEPAEQGQLVILASGPPRARTALQPLFDALGRKTIWLGPAGAGSRLKLVLNAWVLAVVEAGAEIIALAEGLGLDPRLIFEALDGGALDLPYLRMKGLAITQRDFEPAFRLALAAKDAALVDDAAKRHGLELPLLSVLSERLAEGARTHGEKDMSATYLTSASRGAKSAQGAS